MDEKRHGMSLFETSEEHKRYQTMHETFSDITRRVLVNAGIRDGMRVLDLGSGAGHVSLLVAELVGPSGSVVGLEKNPQLVEHARYSAGVAGATNVTFLEADVTHESFPVEGPFDAVTERLVLFGLPNPLQTIRTACNLLKSGGVFVMQEHECQWIMTGYRSWPKCELNDRLNDLWLEAAKRVGVHLDVGVSLYSMALKAGLSNPQTHMDVRMGGGPDFIGYRWWAMHMKLFEPMMVKLGILKEGELGIETLEQRLRDEVVRENAIMVVTPMLACWAKKS